LRAAATISIRRKTPGLPMNTDSEQRDGSGDAEGFSVDESRRGHAQARALHRIPRWLWSLVAVILIVAAMLTGVVLSGMAPKSYDPAKVSPALKALPAAPESVMAMFWLDGGSWSFRFKDDSSREWLCTAPIERTPGRRSVGKERANFPRLYMGASSPDKSGTLVVLDDDNLAYFCERVRSAKSFPKVPGYSADFVPIAMSEVSESIRCQQVKLAGTNPSLLLDQLTAEMKRRWAAFERWTVEL
jgi:hypothetical protein